MKVKSVNPMGMTRPLSFRARELITRSKKSFPSAPRTFSDLILSEANDIIVKDVDGNTYLDFAQSICAIGHCHPRVVNAIKSQAIKLIHFNAALALHEPYVQLAEELRRMAGGSLNNCKVVYPTTGTEACDFSMKLARFYTRRALIMCYRGSYHGLTGSTLGVTNCEPTLKKHSTPLVQETLYLPYPYCYRCDFKQEYPDCELLCFNYIETMFETVAHPTDVAGIITEPMQIHGGVVIPPPGYWKRVEGLCKKHHILIIDDEVFTGLGKSGKFFAIQNWNIEPDIICMGKALGAGLPLAAILSRQEIIDKWELCPGGRLGSFAGNPISCAAALAGIQVIKEEKLMTNAEKIGSHLMRGLRDLAIEHEIIGDVRGKGLMIGLELVKNRKTKTPATEEAMKIANKAFKRGLLLIRVGRYHNVIRITPPLTIKTEHVDKALEILDNLFKYLRMR